MSEQKTVQEIQTRERIECVRTREIQRLSDDNGQATQQGGETTSRELRGEDPTDVSENNGVTQEVARSAISKVLTILVDYMNPTTILQKMIETELLRRSTLVDIMEQKTSSERSRSLLKEVSRKDVTVYIHFKKCLRETKQEHIVKLLEIAEKGGDTEDAINMIKQEAMELNSEENMLLKELTKTIANLDLKKKIIICYVYLYIGREVCKKLLEKIVNDLRPLGNDPWAWTVDTFLHTNRHTIEGIKSTNEKIDILFPKAKLELWDVSLFCIILINTCKVSPSLRICLEWMLERGKKLKKYDRNNYERKFRKMKVHILTISAETGDEDLTRKITTLFDQLESGVIPNTECAIITNKIGLLLEEVRRSRDAMEQHASVTQQTQAEIIKGNQNIERKLDELLEEFRKFNQNNVRQRSEDSLPASPVKIVLQNCSSEAEKVTSQKIVEAINNCGNPSKLSDACEELKTTYKTNGYSVVGAEIGCVQLYIQCTSAVSLINLLKDYVTGRLDASLEPLENAATLLDGCADLKLEAIIFEEDFLNILSSVETMANDVMKNAGLQIIDSTEIKGHTTHKTEMKTAEQSTETTERRLDIAVEKNKEPITTPKSCEKKEARDETEWQIARTKEAMANDNYIKRMGLQDTDKAEEKGHTTHKTEIKQVLHILPSKPMVTLKSYFLQERMMSDQQDIKSTKNGESHLMCDLAFSPPRYEEIMDEEKVRMENLELLIDIAKLCIRRDRKHVENIFLLGKQGAGKSALINTVIKVLAGKHIPKAAVGAGVRQSKTPTLESYKSCGVTRGDIDDPNRRGLVVDILPKLPTIIDCTGIVDLETYDNNPGVLEEILELIIGGFIPPGTRIDVLVALQKYYNVGCLRDVFYTESKPEWKVTKVVFVQSCRDSLPLGLIQCLDRILRKTDPKKVQLKYTVDVFVVITKYDLVSDQTQFQNSSDHRRETISMEDLMKLENTLVKQFSFKGSQEHNMIYWVSYPERVSFDNPYIDNIALTFIKRMLQPGNKPAESVSLPVITQQKIMKMKAKKMWKECNLSVTHVILAVLMICVAILMLKLLSAGPGRTF